MNILSTKHRQRPNVKDLLIRSFRLWMSCLASLGLAAVLIWGLVWNSDPKATLNNLNLKKFNDNYSTLTFEMHFINTNYFRGFNLSDAGWIEFFYVGSESYSNLDYSLTNEYMPKQYLGFRKSTPWNFTLNVSFNAVQWPKYTDPLKKQQSYIYVSLYLVYSFKILFWTTETTYYQWLEAYAYLNNDLVLKDATNFNRMKNITLGIST